MKKFSILTLAVLMAAGSGFAGKVLPLSGKVVMEDSKMMAGVASFAEASGIAAVKKAPAKAPVAADEVVGKYDWSYISLLEGDGTYGPVEIDLVDESTGEVALSGFPQGFVLKGFVDYEKGELSIPNNQYLGPDSYGDINYFYVKGVDEEFNILAGASDQEATVGVYANGQFVFPQFDIWTIGDPENEALGYWLMTCVNVLTIDVDEEQAGQWEPVGECTIVDAWITPSYKFDDGSQIVPSDWPFTAELQRNVDNENIYRVWRPYHSEDYILADNNSSSYNGQIVFDVTDPDHVIVKTGYLAGFANSNGEFCVFGYLGWQIGTFGDAWDDSYLPMVIDFMEEKGQPFDTFKDNVLTVNRSVFDIDIACTNAYTWTDNEYVVSTITFPEGSGVAGVDVAEAPVKYYNLQGVEIVNPAEGQVVICRQGDKAVKKVCR